MVIKYRFGDDDFQALEKVHFSKSGLVDSNGKISFKDLGLYLEFDTKLLGYRDFIAVLDGFDDGFSRKDELYKVIVKVLLDMATEEYIKYQEAQKQQEKEKAIKDKERNEKEKDFLNRLSKKISKKDEDKKETKGKYRLKAFDGNTRLDREFDTLSELDDTLSKFFKSRSYSYLAPEKDLAVEEFQKVFQGVNPIDNLSKEFEKFLNKVEAKKDWWEK